MTAHDVRGGPQSPASWSCDTCAGQVTDPAGAVVVWRGPGQGGGGRAFHDFKIVHKGRCDPQVEAGYALSLGLGSFTGPAGLTLLLSWLSAGPLQGGGRPRIAQEDLDSYVGLVRRVQVPGYEQARRRFGDPGARKRYAACDETWPYTVRVLRRIGRRRSR